MTQETKHTPTPLKAAANERDLRKTYILDAAHNLYIATDSEAKAAFIVHRVNVHDELVSALQMAIRANDWHIEPPADSYGVNAYKACIGALAKARGEA